MDKRVTDMIFRLPAWLRRALDEEAERRGLGISQLLREVIEMYLIHGESSREHRP